ncbi:MAG: 30S ribosomal protein S5 [Candidatus Thermoplasmatota archaeon]|nr:30S ribosomal protein S5 [Candidatus Thermoplasmatota archaeon]
MAGPERRSGSGRGRRRHFTEEAAPVIWSPKTRLGKMVHSKQITTMSDALKTGLPLREAEIVDLLLPDVEDEVIDVKMVQRMTDSGRRVKFVITVAVGNKDGFIGLGQAKGKEVGLSIKRAIENAKMNIIQIRRGCGSWECGCKTPHTIPFAVTGKSGSVEVTFKPAPRGIGLATGDVAKKILRLAGVSDCWAFTEGKTKTVVNYAKGVYDALKKNAEMRISAAEISKLAIIEGNIGVPPVKEEQPPTPPAEPTTTEGA